MTFFYLRSKICFFWKIEKIGKISKGAAFIYLRSKWTKRCSYLLPSAHFTFRQNNTHGSHGMFLPFIRYATFLYSLENSFLNIFFILFLKDGTKIKDIFWDFVTLTERFCLQMYTPCSVKDGHIIAYKNPSIYNILLWVAWTMGQTNRQPRVGCSKYYFLLYFL